MCAAEATHEKIPRKVGCLRSRAMNLTIVAPSDHSPSAISARSPPGSRISLVWPNLTSR